MNPPRPSWLESLHDEIVAHGFAFAPGSEMHARLRQFGALQDWDAFADSWGDLALDTYLLNHGRYRRRRYAVFEVSAAAPHEDPALKRAPHQPHYQSREYNSLQGGIERWFEPILPQIGDSTTLHTILRFCQALFSTLLPRVPTWHVEVHQFRIEARPGEAGQPTPEGVHRDGVDYVLVLMIRRRNIAQGTTTIHARDGTPLGSFTLDAPFDAALVDDARVYHGVTAVEPIEAEKPAYRDVLVVTFRRDDG